MAIGVVAAACGLAAPAGIGAAGAASRAMSATAAATCPSVLFVGARGTGEAGPGTPGWKPGVDYNGLGGDVDSVLTHVEHDVDGQRTFQVIPVSYQANSVWTLISDPAKYFKGIAAGAATTLSDLTGQARKCPFQQVVLTGFSQGAMVMHRVLHQLSGTPADAGILHRIAAAVLVADGDQVPDDNQLRFGSAALTARGVGQAYRTISHTSDAKFSVSAGTRVLSICDKHDIVCGWTDTNIVDCLLLGKYCPVSVAKMIAVHLGYRLSKPLIQAAGQASLNLLALKYTGPAVSLTGAPGSRLTATVKVTGGSLPLTATARGTVPAGVSVRHSSRTITISGTPASAGSWGFNVTVQDDAGGEATIPVKIVSASTGTWTAADAPAPANARGNRTVPLGVSCPSVSYCVAVGVYQDESADLEAGLLLTRSAGRWTAAEAPAPANAASNLNLLPASVSCASASFCVAVGGYDDAAGDEDGLLLTWTGGSWTAAQALVPADAASDPHASLSGVSCPSASFCVAVGEYTETSGDQGALLLTWTGGSWIAAAGRVPANARSTPADAALSGVSCPSASTCVAVGTYYSDQTNYANGLLLDWSGGSWTPKEAPLPANADASEPAVGLAGVSCPSVSRCEVIGDYYGGNPVTSDGLMLTWSGGSWTVAQAPSAWYAGLSCASAWSCVAIDNTAAVGIGAQAVSLLDSTGALVHGLVDDIERAMSMLRIVNTRDQPNPRPLAIQPPVGRKGHQAAAVGASDGAGP